MSQEQVEQIAIDIERANANISKAEALKRLMDSKDFKSIILDGYFKEEASRCVLLKADSNMSAQDQLDLDKQIIAIGELHSHFNVILRLGAMAREAVQADLDTQTELLNEES